MVNRKPKVAVLAGGISTERDVSLQSGACVAEGLCRGGLPTIVSDIAPDNLEALEDITIDVFFIALHGAFGEDGQLQQILDDGRLCYVGSGPEGCRLAADKMASKKVFAQAGVRTPPVVEFRCDCDTNLLKDKLGQLGEKFVVKPISHGSSVGVRIADCADLAVDWAKDCFGEFGECMIEKYIPGREITVGILNGKPLPIVEVRPKTGFYDYHAKYIDDSTQYLFDTIDDDQLKDRIRSDAVKCFQSLGCRHFARVDFVLADDGRPYVLELNTIPGMTTHSLVPKAAAKTGLSMSDLCVKLVKTAWAEYQNLQSPHQTVTTICGKKKKNKEPLYQSTPNA